jgi:copper chaperone CopZ
MNTVVLFVPGIHCGHCTRTIEMELGEMAGVASVTADRESRRVSVMFDAPASEEKIRALLAEINFPAGND